MKKIIVVAVLLFGYQMIAQTIVKSSIDSGGASTTNGNIEILYTIGEVNIQELSAGNIILSEGFISSTSSTSLSNIDFTLLKGLIVYPNPTFGEIYVNGDHTKIKSIEVYSIMGKKLLSLNTNFRQINVSAFSSSVLFLKIMTDKGSKTFKILKY